MGDSRAEQRQRYAEEIAAIGGIDSQVLLRAFSVVPREDFLPPGPWDVENIQGSYYRTQDASVSRILHAVGVCLDLPRALNTGNPARIARFLEAVDIKPGETVFHIGCGLGYFSAIMAELVGENGCVIAAEIDPGLRAQARQNHSDLHNVEVVEDALTIQLPPVDVIFSSAGMATIHRPWTDSLRSGGRMLLPLTGTLNSGFVFIFRKMDDDATFSARRCDFMRFYPLVGVRDAAGMSALDKVLADRRPDLAQGLKLRLDNHQREGDCWLHRDDFCICLEN